MTDFALGLLLLIFAAMALPITFQSLVRRGQESNATTLFALMCVSNALWAISYALFFLVKSQDAALMFFELRHGFICFASIFMYYFVRQSIRQMPPTKSLVMLACSVPVVTIALVLTNKYHGLVRTSLAMGSTYGIRTIVVKNGPWFYIHCAFCYMLLLLALRIMVSKYFSLPSRYRLPITVMLFGLTSTIATSAVYTFGLIPYPFDISTIVIQITQALYYYASFHAHLLDMVLSSRDTIVENSANTIFVLSPSGKIVDYNATAGDIGKDLGLKNLYNMAFDDFIAQMGKHFDMRFSYDDESVFTIHESDSDSFYQIQKNEVFNRKNEVIISYVTIANVTPTISFIHKLQDFAYFDHLTGLFNRRSFFEKIDELNETDCMPLGIVVGDVNRLKLVNDTNGHTVGDLLLQSITDILKDSSAHSTMWFRIGGDEFAALCPNTSEQEIESMFELISQKCKDIDKERFLNADIALGYRIKRSKDEDVLELLKEADRQMYINKYDRRQSPRS